MNRHRLIWALAIVAAIADAATLVMFGGMTPSAQQFAQIAQSSPSAAIVGIAISRSLLLGGAYIVYRFWRSHVAIPLFFVVLFGLSTLSSFAVL